MKEKVILTERKKKSRTYLFFVKKKETFAVSFLGRVL